MSRRVLNVCVALLACAALSCDELEPARARPAPIGAPERGAAPPSPAPEGPKADPLGDVAASIRWLDQGWSKEQIDRWYTTPQGSELMPYRMFMALEQAEGAALLRDVENMQRLRFLTGYESPRNPDGLPVGLVKDGESIGMTCAACHTNQINYQGVGLWIDGGPAMADFNGFMEGLVAAIEATLRDATKFERFAARVLGDGASEEAKRALHAELKQVYKVRASALKVNHAEVPAGYARLDAFGRIINKALRLADARNGSPSDAPVSYPFLWDTPQHDYVQWNGFAANIGLGPLQRNVGQIIGVFGSIELDVENAAARGYPSSANIPNLIELESLARSLQSPVWPEDVLPKLDERLLARGETIYAEQCERCHQRIDRASPTRRVVAQMIGLESIGTDPRAASSIITAGGLSGALAGQKEEITEGRVIGPQLLGLQAISNLIAGVLRGNMAGETGQKIAALARAGASSSLPAKQGDYPRDPKNPLASLLAYKARSLNGVWATAPFLHNGSVPTLDDLLRSPEQRPARFWVGRLEFDPARVGFVSEAFPGGYEFDTSKPGNSNAGHTYGTTLSDPDRAALLEFLKSL